MRTQDNIVIGKSYFNAEIDRLAQVIGYGLANYPTLLILDEVLKGAYSEDKLQRALELLEFFSERNFMTIVATHDIGVTLLENKYADSKFKYYCFEIELGDSINYTYRITSGVCKNRNVSCIINIIISKFDSPNLLSSICLMPRDTDEARPFARFIQLYMEE